MSRLDRFKRLEAPRTERPGDAQKKTQERFTRMEPERAPADLPPPPPPPPGPAAERIRRQVSDQPLALDHRNTQEQQFIRCMHCEGDNGRYATHCIHCSAALQTDEQRDYNEQFWRQRQAQVAEEQQAVEQFQANRERLAQEQAEVRQRAYEAMVEEARAGDFSGGEGSTPPGVRLIRAIESPALQRAVVAGLVVVAVLAGYGLTKLRRGPEWLPFVCIGALLALLLLFTPPGWWTYRGRRRRGWFFDDDDYFP